MGIRPSIRPSMRLAMLTLLVLLLLPGSALGFSKAFWGPGFEARNDPFPIFRQLGVTLVQEDLDWSVVAPTQPANPTDPRDPAYQWPAALGRIIQRASKFHMRILLQVITAPSWANGGNSPNWAPTHAADYADFVAAAARHYGNVHLWMVWGEPTRASNFDPLVPARPGEALSPGQQTAPHKYAEMLDATYGALKKISRSNLVIGGCTYSAGEIDTQQWVQNLRLPNGMPPRLDIYAHNPFTWREPRFGQKPSAHGQVQFTDLPRLAHWIDTNLGRPRHVRKPIPIFISEWNEPTAREHEFAWWLSQSAAARFTREALRASRHWKRIYGFGWIELYDDPPFESAGLLTKRGAKKRDFYAFKNG